MNYAINVFHGNAVYFAVAEKSLPSETDAVEVFRDLCKRFPAREGYYVELLEVSVEVYRRDSRDAIHAPQDVTPGPFDSADVDPRKARHLRRPRGSASATMIDDHGDAVTEARVLPLGSDGGNLIIGRAGYDKEMELRRDMNERLCPDGDTWELPPWESLRVYFQDGRYIDASDFADVDPGPAAIMQACREAAQWRDLIKQNYPEMIGLIWAFDVLRTELDRIDAARKADPAPSGNPVCRNTAYPEQPEQIGGSQ